MTTKRAKLTIEFEDRGGKYCTFTSLYGGSLFAWPEAGFDTVSIRGLEGGGLILILEPHVEAAHAERATENEG